MNEAEPGSSKAKPRRTCGEASPRIDETAIRGEISEALVAVGDA
jgi:hypothetical protein